MTKILIKLTIIIPLIQKIIEILIKDKNDINKKTSRQKNQLEDK